MKNCLQNVPYVILCFPFCSGDFQSSVIQTEGGFKCLLCGTVMKHSRNLKRHYVDKHNNQETAHVCGICGKVYKSKNSLETHRYMYHRENNDNSKQLQFL